MNRPEDSGTRASLLSRLRRNVNDPDSWKEFVERYGPKIYRWCKAWHLQDADAEDVGQQVLLRATVGKCLERSPGRVHCRAKRRKWVDDRLVSQPSQLVEREERAATKFRNIRQERHVHDLGEPSELVRRLKRFREDHIGARGQVFP